MPQQRRNPASRLNPRRPLVLSTRTLGRSPGSLQTLQLTAPAPAGMSVGMVGVPEGADLALDIQLAAVSEGVLVTVAATVPLAGECARCLDPLAQTMDLRFQELFHYDQGTGEDPDDGYSLAGDLLDLEPVLRDAVVLALPLAPLCREDCPGLCAECGAQLARVGKEHRHEAAIDPRWAQLARHLTAAGPDGAPAPETRQESGRGRP
ncbi:MAG: YceD family protein [Gemmatimonadota bacterium]